MCPSSQSAPSPETSLQEDRWVVAGRVVRAHGVHGAVRVALDLAAKDFRSRPKSLRLRRRGRDAQETLAISDWREIHRAFLLTFEPTLTREQAMAYAGAEVSVLESSLTPPDSDDYYFYELVGAALHDKKGRKLGVVTDIFDNQGQALLAVEDTEGQSQLLPLVPEFCLAFDRELMTMEVEVPEDLWE